ncbi:MAG: hypothetical protein C4581_06305 [Nitrospiraceae bacterium]|nr:MAG: hypothetical protein C4581_06305 [Nitrospiraceae bacterium]
MPEDIRLLKAEISRLKKIISAFSPSLEIMLKRRGFTIYRKEPSGDLLVPDRKYEAAFLNKLKKYSFRLFLRDVIKHQDAFTLEKVTRYTTIEVAALYINFLLKAGLAESSGKCYHLTKRPVKSFGETLEWFVSQLIRKHFQAETAWGVKFKRPKVGGDYDLIAKVDSSLLYMEIKSSPPKGIHDREIKFFLDRIVDLSPDIPVFFVDTELRMKDKIVPMFEAELRRRYKKPIKAERIVKELFHINRKIFIINAKESISDNIETILTFLYHKEFKIT